jgi:hypothetical protein
MRLARQKTQASTRKKFLRQRAVRWIDCTWRDIGGKTRMSTRSETHTQVITQQLHNQLEKLFNLRMTPVRKQAHARIHLIQCTLCMMACGDDHERFLFDWI